MGLNIADKRMITKLDSDNFVQTEKFNKFGVTSVHVSVYFWLLSFRFRLLLWLCFFFFVVFRLVLFCFVFIVASRRVVFCLAELRVSRCTLQRFSLSARLTCSYHLKSCKESGGTKQVSRKLRPRELRPQTQETPTLWVSLKLKDPGNSDPLGVSKAIKPQNLRPSWCFKKGRLPGADPRIEKDKFCRALLQAVLLNVRRYNVMAKLAEN